MKRVFRLLVLLISTVLVINTGCKRNSTPDPADIFVGTYSYTLTSSDLGSDSGDVTITKTSSSKISISPTGGTPTPYTVNGNSITEDAGQTIPVSETSTATFTEKSKGSLNGNVLTINGTWTNSKYTTLRFKIVATKK